MKLPILRKLIKPSRIFEAGTETWEDAEIRTAFCVDFDLVKGSLTVRNRRQGIQCSLRHGGNQES